MPDLLVIHGPNLNLLGTREPQHYGRDTLAEINQRLQDMATRNGASLEAVQSNAEDCRLNTVESCIAHPLLA